MCSQSHYQRRHLIQIANLKQRLTNANAERRELGIRLEKTRQKYRQGMTDQHKELQVLRQTKDSLIRKLEDEYARAHHADSYIEKQERELERLRQECSALRTFADATDECSEVEVVGAMTDLNAKIGQLAASLSDQWETAITKQEAVDSPAPLPADQKEWLDRKLGRWCASLLYNQAWCPPSARESLVIQYAVQTLAVRRALSHFKCLVSGQSGHKLDTLYDEIFAEGKFRHKYSRHSARQRLISPCKLQNPMSHPLGGVL